MFKYCIIRDGVNVHTLCRGNPLFTEVFVRGEWVNQDLGGIYSGDLTHRNVSSQVANNIVDGVMTETEAYKYHYLK